MRFVFPHSHAFQRGRVNVDDDEKPGPECLVELGDGVTVIAEWHLVDDAIIFLFLPIAPRREQRLRRGAGGSSEVRTASIARNVLHERLAASATSDRARTWRGTLRLYLTQTRRPKEIMM